MRCFLSAAIFVGAVVLIAPGAMACSVAIGPAPPDPPSGLSSEAQAQFRLDWEEAEARRQEAQAEQWRLQYQAEKWTKADGVLLARIETVVPYQKQSEWGGSLELVRVEMRPVRWLKGAGKLAPFQIATTGFSSCGYHPGWEGLRGSPGEEFVVYFRGAAPSLETVTEAIAPASIREPNARAALELRQ